MSTSPSRWLFALALAVTLGGAAGCKGATPSQGAPGQKTEKACAPTGNKNADVMNALASDCASCHGKGTNKPFFESLAAFEGTLAYDTKYVVPGKPEESELIRLLRGQGKGTYAQMPTTGATFAADDAAGKTQVSMADLEDWIRNLPPEGGPNFDYMKAPTVRRLTAPEVLESLNEPLGLTDRDFFDDDKKTLTLVDGDRGLPARTPDALAYRDDDAFVSAQVYPRWLALGGPAWQLGKPPDTSVSATFLETLTQMSQARCRKAVTKRGNAAFFRFVSATESSEKAKDGIRKNIGYLHLRLLGEPATEADIDDLYESVFVPYEKTDLETAWTAVCAALVRHPLWAAY